MPLSKIQDIGNQVIPNLGRRNLIINGSMQVAQRGTSSTGVGYQTVDRFAVNQSNFDNLVSTKTQDTSVPDGFSKSFKIATTTAETALASDEYANMSYAIEGQDLQSLAYGTSSAKSFTLSFYVKSNLTGNFSVTAYKQTGSNKQQDRQYTINSANTWERKTLTFVGDTAQSIVNSSAVGMYLYWHTAFGSGFGTATYNGNAGWGAYSNAGWGAGQDNNTLYNSTSNYLQFTGIQMEVGDAVTDFEHLSFAEELLLCQRYFNMHSNLGTNTALSDGFSWDATEIDFIYTFPVEMRATPSIYQVTGANYFKLQGNGGTTYIDGNWTLQYASKFATSHYATSDGSRTAGDSCHITFNNTAARLGYSAEL